MGSETLYDKCIDAKMYTFIDIRCLRIRLMGFISLIHRLIRFYCRNEYFAAGIKISDFPAANTWAKLGTPTRFVFLLLQPMIQKMGQIIAS